MQTFSVHVLLKQAVTGIFVQPFIQKCTPHSAQGWSSQKSNPAGIANTSCTN